MAKIFIDVPGASVMPGLALKGVFVIPLTVPKNTTPIFCDAVLVSNELENTLDEIESTTGIVMRVLKSLKAAVVLLLGIATDCPDLAD